MTEGNMDIPRGNLIVKTCTSCGKSAMLDEQIVHSFDCPTLVTGDIREGIQVKLKAICRKTIGIGCPYSYDCELHDCMHDESIDFVQYLRSQGVVKKVDRELPDVVEIIKGLLPLNSYGGCFYCGIGSKPNEDMMHFDTDNVWGADQMCLMHRSYKEARDFIAGHVAVEEL